MKKGGKRLTVEEAPLAIRIGAILVPIVLTAYGLLIQYGFVHSIAYTSDIFFYTLMMIWVVFGTFIFLDPPVDKRKVAMQLIAYHLLSAAFILLVAGFTMTFVICWVLLLIISQLQFGEKGFRLSVAALVTLALVDIMLYADRGASTIENIFALVSVILVGSITVLYTKSQHTDKADLANAKKEKNLQRDRILALINNLAEAVVSVDQRGIVRVYNAAVLGLLDTNDSINGKHIDDILKLYEDRKVVRLSKLLQDSHGVIRDESYHISLGGEDIRLEITHSPIRGDNTNKNLGHIIILRDITKSKSLEEERDEFISVVSHELRTPITIAEGSISNAQLLFERKDSRANLIGEGLASAHEQVVFLSKMVNDLSTLSRAERGVADEAEVIDVDELAHTLFNEYSPEASKKDLVLNLDIHGKLGNVKASRLYLHELLQNFITNAIKYTKEGTVTLKISKKDGQVLFSVKDSGIGISKADQIKIFDKFYRSEDYRTRETGGTGLGLYVSAKLAKKLGCQIELTSRLNYGSTFSFSLPSSKEKAD